MIETIGHWSLAEIRSLRLRPRRPSLFGRRHAARNRFPNHSLPFDSDPLMSTIQTDVDPQQLLRPNRTIKGMSAILLPFKEDGEVDWEGYEGHVKRTLDAGLIPAVNMDTGYVNLIDDDTRLEVLRRVGDLTTDFVAGAFVLDKLGATFDLDGYMSRVDEIQKEGGTPVIFQSFGLTGQDEPDVVRAYQEIGSRCNRFIGFELGQMFAPFGRVYSLDVYRELLQVESCIGAKHSSLDRIREWQRLQLRDAVRPDFMVLTGNDLAIDMVMYGSDYLLGLSTFAPDLFGKRDRYWAAGDPLFYALNDVLQYLGFLTFRRPVPAYKHSAAMFLKLRGWISTDQTHPNSPTRPFGDREIYQDILRQFEEF